jgi:hypothetical protein
MNWNSGDSMAKTRLRRLTACLLIGLGGCSSLLAQYEMKSGVYNRLSQRIPATNTGKIAPVGPNGTPTGDPTITPQYSNVVESSASAGPITSGYPKSSTGIKLSLASVGTSFASGVPRYFYGDQIIPPVAYINSSGTSVPVSSPSTFWRAEPVVAGEVLTNPSGAPATDARTGESAVIAPLAAGVLPTYYYSPHAKVVFANTPGTVEVTWRSSLPDSTSNSYIFYKERFNVSSATSTPVRTIFWTEKSYNGPRVTIPSGRIVTVNPIYSNVFPETVASEYVVVGSSAADPNSDATQILRTLWYEKSNGIGELHAYNQVGRILVEYLGALRDDGTHEFLGADIVSVEQAAVPKTITTYLGNEIRPQPDENLKAVPVTTGSTTDVAYYGSNPRPDGSLAYYAERENAIEDRVSFYWLENHDAEISLTAGTSPGLSIDWPKYLNKYLQAWPGDVTEFASSTVAQGGSSTDTGTGLKFEDGKIPKIIYQDDPSGAESVIDTVSQRLIVGLGVTVDQQNRSLLKFTGDNGGIWYVRLITQAEDRSGYQEGDGGAALTGAAYVGERINPPSSDYTQAGFVSKGTSYSPTAYIDPFAQGVAAAEKGAIIPVNALPGSANQLAVWWFKKIQAPSSEFSDFYVPSKIGRYSVAYRTSPEVAENFDAGSVGWSSNTTSTLLGITGLYNGPYGAGASPSTSKTFSTGASDGNITTISFTFHRLDSWDGENFKVLVNGNVVLQQAFNLNEKTTTLTGTSSFGFDTYDWSMKPVPGSYTNLYGNTGWKDQSFDVVIRATSTGGVPPASIALGFASTLDQGASDEAFGIDNVTISEPLAQQIIMASNFGTGSLLSAVSAGTVYNQPDPSKAGYNPNEEHALIQSGVGYALRDDLNLTAGTSVGTTFTSLPRVLIQYKDPADNRPAISVYEVLRENSAYRFSYPVTAGTILNSPMPLPILPQPLDASGFVRNAEVIPGAAYSDPPASSTAPSTYTPFTFKDRKGYVWVYRGPHDTGTPSLGMQWYYTMRPDFVFPNITQPATGTILPYLRTRNTDGTYAGDPVSGTSQTVLYYPTWPTDAPTLSVGETLALPNHGLPAVRGQSSATVLYQQSIAKTTAVPSVTLHDPTRAKSVLLNDARVGLTALPASLKTTAQDGKTYFQLAQPHLQQRFYFDPNLGDIGGLVLIGEFVDEIAGEDYINLNTLSPADVKALNVLVDASDGDLTKWTNAILALTTMVETFKENPSVKGTYIVDTSKTKNVGSQSLPEISDSNTAVDSYALTALGNGSGYVTLLFANGDAFTPKGDPIAMQIVKVLPQLYQGDLKMIAASNPLDEQTSLRHSGDFAAHPENYEFQWAYSPPEDGVVPPIYSNAMMPVLGTSTTLNWYLLANPPVVPPGALVYPTTQVTLSRSIQINNASHSPTLGLPGQILKSVSGVVFSSPVPDSLVFSASLGMDDGLVLFVNGVPALAYQIPYGTAVPGNLAPQGARSGLIPDGGGLTYQFPVDPAFFQVGSNQIEVALYSSQASGGSSSTINFQIHAALNTDLVEASPSKWLKPSPGSEPFTNTIVIGGSAGSPLGNPLLVFSDTYFTMRYRAKQPATLVTGASWSEWNTPVLVESWVKRVLDGINPFNQRQTDLYNNPVSTDVSILTQAGSRWEGDVALNLDTIEDFGLIEIYETVLNRVKKQSIDANINDASVNSTLLLVAGYLNDLYMTLGNEAWDDAQNPTLLIDSANEMVDTNSSRFSFEGQVASMMDETLALLRGRDDFLSPGTTVNPSYNRLYWNYTNGINSGEPFYAVNYNIKEKVGGKNEDGVLDAADAQAMFPQGHGDAYGHYLTALTGYYKLLTSPNYTWIPTTEGVTVLGQTVQVDYQDERKFAAAASSLARTGVDIISFTARSRHSDGEEDGWADKYDGKYNSASKLTRHWGTDEWCSRVIQGAYYNWVSANAMLPDVDAAHEGIQKIDRTTVPELNELVTSANEAFSLSAGEQAHLNPLGIAPDAMVFDISPSELAAGKSHFDQVYERAVRAAVNAKNSFDQAGKMNHMLRRQGDSVDEYNDAVDRQEDAYEYQLLTLYGSAYAGDMGPGKLYVQGYTGPDLYHSYFIDRPSQLVDTSTDVTVNFNEPINTDPFKDWSVDNVYNKLRDPLQYTTRSYRVSPYTLGQFSDTVASGMGKRGQVGEIQSALLACYEAQVNLRDSSNSYNNLLRRFDRDYQLYSEFLTDFDAANDASAAKIAEAAAMTKASFTLTSTAAAFALSGDYIRGLAAATAEALPTSVGLANDATSVGRMAAILSGETAGYAQQLLGLSAETMAALLDAEAADLEGQAQDYIDDYNFDSVKKQHVVEFERLYDQVLGSSYEISRRLTELQHANERVSKLYANANHILSERETFRQRAASVTQGYRTRDLVFRDLRNEELSQYKNLFDLAQTYAYCAAKAYDYETGLLDSTVGDAFINEVVGSFSVGAWNGDNPIETGKGDSGLASALGGLRDDWSVVKGRLGINNPDRNGTLFSLRQELFRIRADQPTADDNTLWKQVIQQHIMSNVLNDPDVAMYCNNIRKSNGSAVPGIVIPFSTTIEQGLNFFGWPLAAGDHSFSQSTFATKIYSSGLVFKGYVGMDPYSIGVVGASGPASSGSNALSATPYAYLIPAGKDTMRTPPLGDTNTIRSWSVKDQALPLPKNLGGTSFSSGQFFTPEGSLSDQLWIVRKHQAFRAVDDPAYFYSSMPAEFTNSRLVGRSAWNTQWKIVIPAYSLLSDEQVGLDRFAQSVSDIKLFLRTYSNSGN